MRGERLRFVGVTDRDVYNPTREFVIGGKRVLAARVESRASETDSIIQFFERKAGAWHLVAGAPQLALQDPFVAPIGDEIVLGGVEVKVRGEGLRWRTVFYRGRTLSELTWFLAGPWGMKDIRLASLDDGRIFVLTRPSGRRGGRGKIGYTIAPSLDQLTSELIAAAPIIAGQFAASEWGGANEIIPLERDRFGVLGHIARFDVRSNRHYYPIAFEIDLAHRTVSESRLLLERRDLPGGIGGASKRPDLKDVVFPGGLERRPRGRALLYLGAGDAEVHCVELPDPFHRR